MADTAQNDVQLLGIAEVEALRGALSIIANKIPQAAPGGADPTHGAGYVTNQMIGAVAYLSARLPSIPGEVKTALQLLGTVGVYALATTDIGRATLDKIRVAISKYAGTLAKAIAAYDRLLPAGGTAPSRLPAGSIALYVPDKKHYRVAVPKDAVLAGPELGLIPVGRGTHTEVGVSTTPGTAQVVGEDTYKKATWRWYKSGWVWGPVGVVVLGGVGFLLWRKKRRR